MIQASTFADASKTSSGNRKFCKKGKVIYVRRTRSVTAGDCENRAAPPYDSASERYVPHRAGTERVRAHVDHPPCL